MKRNLALVTAAVLTLVPFNGAPASAAAGGCSANPVQSYLTDTTDPDVGPFGVTQGPGGTWYAAGDTITRVTNDRITQFTVPGANALGWLSWDGTSSSVWFADRGGVGIGTIDGKGAVREYQVPAGGAGALVLGPGPHVWFTGSDGQNPAIGDLNTATGATIFPPVPSGDPLGLARGADGALYFTERAYDKVGRMAPDGTFTEWDLAPGAFPNRLVLGPDGAVWFTELFGGQLGRITTSGTLTETPIDGGPVGITVGSDGHLYVALWLAHQVARVDASGTVTRTWSVPGALQVAPSRDGIWTTDPYTFSTTRVRTQC